MRSNRPPGGASNVAIGVTVGLNWAAALLIGFFGGRAVDAHFHTSPAFMIIGLLLGMAGGMWGSYRIVQRQLDDEDKGT